MISIGSEGVWSAVPTPFDESMHLDVNAVVRMVEHHINCGVKGLFLGGTCGEGLWMRRKDIFRLTCAAVDSSMGRLTVAVQVTDTSAPRILENIDAAHEAGADIAVIAPPLDNGGHNAKTLMATYMQAIERSSLPVGIYDRGKYGSPQIPVDVLNAAYKHPKVVMIKDSSTDKEHMQIALKAREERPELKLLTGYEFGCVEYLQAGYDGLLLGGGVFNALIARKIIDAVAAGDIQEADRQQERMNELMYAVYGGKEISCWLAGLKHLLVKMGIFSTANLYMDYSLSDECSKAIDNALIEYKDVLNP